jgi:activating signal cointegrator complex subunit 3
MRYIASQTDNPVRLVCLSTAVANARDLADWLGIEGHEGLFNFRPSVRPVPLEAHIQGYPGDHYCPRMATMNKPTYAAIKAHSPAKPVLIFVSSRRQTRLTALDLIAFLGTEDNPRQFLRMPEAQLEPLLARVTDANLRHTLPFGIGLHHAGLTRDDKAVVEELFGANRIQVLISTSTLAWGVNLPAHLVVIKGTEFFDPKTRRYLDFPITDVLQMMGRAGRPQFDTYAKAVIMVHEPKKNFYKKFLYEPFPVESSLHTVLHDHFNAEIVSGTIASKQDAVDYLTWTYYFRRLLVNPAYYDLEATDAAAINRHLSERVDAALRELEASHCLEIDEVDGTSVYPLTFGRIASYYYLHHTTMRLFYDAIGEDNDLRSLLDVLAGTAEYDELPVRHNEDKLNEELAATVPWPVDAHLLDDPHTKTNLLLQAHFAGLALPISDYITDTKSVLDQAVRILQAMVDVAADGGWLKTTLNCMHLMQMVMQARWFTDSTLLTLPHADDRLVLAFADALGVDSLPELLALDEARVQAFLRDRLSARQTREFIQVLRQLPVVDLRATVDLSAAAAAAPPEKLNSKAKAAAQNGAHDDDNDDDDGYDRHHDDDDDDDGYDDEGDEEEGVEEEEEAAEGVVKVELSLANKDHSRLAYTPRFTKQKEPAWWVVLGNPDTGELLALRRYAPPPVCRVVSTKHLNVSAAHTQVDDSAKEPHAHVAHVRAAGGGRRVHLLALPHVRLLPGPRPADPPHLHRVSNVLRSWI